MTQRPGYKKGQIIQKERVKIYGHIQQGCLHEKHNGFLRRFLPKGCDINEYSEEIQEIENKLNHKPRKKLGYKTPYEVYHNINLTYLK